MYGSDCHCVTLVEDPSRTLRELLNDGSEVSTALACKIGLLIQARLPDRTREKTRVVRDGISMNVTLYREAELSAVKAIIAEFFAS
jgi:hypothetical protein